MVLRFLICPVLPFAPYQGFCIGKIENRQNKGNQQPSTMKGSVTMPLPQKQIYTESDYYALPEDIRAELIDGQIYYQAAPSYKHQKILGYLYKIIANYIDSKGGPCEVLPAPFAVKLREDRKTIVEPDISVICDRDKLTDKGCTGAPDWIIEIVSPGNSSQDYIRKLNLYADAGVREYWIVDPNRCTVTVNYFEDDSITVQYPFGATIKVNIYDDLFIDFKAIEQLLNS